MEKLYNSLEMNEIQKQVKSFCASTLGKEQVDDFCIETDQEDLIEALDKVKEAMLQIEYHGRLPLGGLKDIQDVVEKSRRDAILYPEELMHVATHHACVINVKQYISNSELQTPYIKDLIDGLFLDEYLKDEIERCILPDWTVSDDASPALFSIRKQMRQIERNIRQKMDSLVKTSKDSLSIDAVTTKNDRLVLPVKAGYKNQFGGIVHAQSATGQTVYVEPEAIMLMNNELSNLQLKEREEVNKILFQMSQHVKVNYQFYIFNKEIFAELDFVFAKALYGYHNDCCIAQVSENIYDLCLKEARHPLIPKDDVVANTIALDEHKMFLITGSNTGGKTVVLKTVGLLTLMTLCGMPIPCNEAVVPMYDQIFVDLGDGQSIEQSLSTFSSHIKNIINILDHATSRSLVIIDEIGSGTDPREGESLAQAILMRFLQKNITVFASTHYSKLKTFALENEDVQIASVTFDLDQMKPTYKLVLDTAGSSYAIEISQILGLDDAIIDEAQNLREAATGEHEKLMTKLQKEQDELDRLKDEMSFKEEQVHNLEKELTYNLNNIEQQRIKILDTAQKEANTIVQDARENIDTVVETLKLSQVKQHEVIQAKKDLDDLIQHDEKIQKQDHKLSLYDHIRVNKMNREGDIVEILKNHLIMVDIGGMKIKLHEDEVTYLHPKTKVKPVKKVKVKSTQSKKTGSYEINVIGKRYEEAMDLVDKFLDDALVMGYPHVRIVHGMGTGTLRKGIRKLLEKNKNVVSYRDGGPNEGGLGATLAYFE